MKIIRESKNLSKLKLSVPGGGFYIFPDMSNFLNTKRPDNGNLILNDDDFANYLLEYAQVVVLPGSTFSKINHFRLVYLRSLETIESGLKQMEMALEALIK